MEHFNERIHKRISNRHIRATQQFARKIRCLTPSVFETRFINSFDAPLNILMVSAKQTFNFNNQIIPSKFKIQRKISVSSRKRDMFNVQGNKSDYDRWRNGDTQKVRETLSLKLGHTLRTFMCWDFTTADKAQVDNARPLLKS